MQKTIHIEEMLAPDKKDHWSITKPTEIAGLIR